MIRRPVIAFHEQSIVLECRHTRAQRDFNPLPTVGAKVRCLACEKVVRRVESEGRDYMTEGEWQAYGRFEK